MPTWEYLTFSRVGGRWTDDQYDSRTPGEKINDCGREGWDLVSAFYDGSGYHFYLKRPLGEAAKPPRKKSVAKG